MKRAAILCFTQRGQATAEAIATALQAEYEVSTRRLQGGKNGAVESLFQAMDALVFVGACGIAVRMIAPFLQSKATDPAVVVVDERGVHAVSLLSGHIGGANELTPRIASAIGARPVITTATDVNGRFAADEWAKQNGLAISSMQAAKRFSAEILRRDLPVRSDFPMEGKLRGGLYRGESGPCGLSISCRAGASPADWLTLIPKKLHLGIGCKRGASMETIHAAVQGLLDTEGIYAQALARAASIDVKRDEAGLLAFCEDRDLPISFYSAEELRAVEGAFSASAFVEGVVGVDNVCERAAVHSAGEGARLIVKKTCSGGVTVAVAQEKWSVCLE